LRSSEISRKALEASIPSSVSGGVLVTLVSPIPPDVAEQHGARGVFFVDQIAGLVDAGKLKPVISEVVALARGREAFQQGAAGHASGKIVVQVAA
jgi:NADPH:quinone reductase-like Zn-dependent oxidoreductase